MDVEQIQNEMFEYRNAGLIEGFDLGYHAGVGHVWRRVLNAMEGLSETVDNPDPAHMFAVISDLLDQAEAIIVNGGDRTPGIEQAKSSYLESHLTKIEDD